MPDEEKQDLKERLAGVFKDPVQAAKIANVLVPSKRPDGWSKFTNAPYFKEVYALEMKSTLDTVVEQKQDVIYDYATFESMGMSKSTVYLRVNQSLLYLLKYLDPDGKYANIRHNMIQITKERGVGVRISLLPQYREGFTAEFQPRAVIPQSEMPLWRKKMEHFLENAQPGASFYKEGLALTPEEIKELNDSFMNVSGFIVNITSFSVKIVRIDEEGL